MNDALRRSVEYAGRAPSVHNTQPWRFRVDGSVLTLYADLRRRLEVLDPAGRQLVVSCGAALANVDLALRVEGLLPAVHLVPDGTMLDRLAVVQVTGRHHPTDLERMLFAAIAHRATNRHALDGSAISPELLAGLTRLANGPGVSVVFVEEEQAYDTLRLVARLADRSQSASRSQRDELRRWSRSDDSAPDGVPYSARGLGAAGARRLSLPVRDFDVDGRAGHAVQLPDATADRPVVAAILTEGDRPRDWLRAGIALERVLLAVTAAGLGASFVNQPVDDAALRPRVAELAGAQGYAQVLLRIGAGVAAQPTPRRPVEDLLDALAVRRAGPPDNSH